MNLNDFQNIIEIQSIENKTNKCSNEIQSEEKRIIDLERQRLEKSNLLVEKNESLDKLQKSHSDLEKELYEVDKKINKSNENIHLVKSETQAKAIEKELDLLNPKKDELENNVLEILDQVDVIEQEICDIESFLKGSKNTLTNINNEVLIKISEQKQIIKSYSSRLSELTADLQPDIAITLEKLNKRYKIKQFISLVENSVCNVCKFHIERHLQSLVENASTLEHCPNCTRILIPTAARTSSTV